MTPGDVTVRCFVAIAFCAAETGNITYGFYYTRERWFSDRHTAKFEIILSLMILFKVACIRIMKKYVLFGLISTIVNTILLIYTYRSDDQDIWAWFNVLNIIPNVIASISSSLIELPNNVFLLDIMYAW